MLLSQGITTSVAQRIERFRPKEKMGVQFPPGVPFGFAHGKHNMQIHPTVKQILSTLADAGFEAFIVGGCVRDLLMDRAPKDWDITTNATPEKIQELFPEHFYENAFGTVTIKTGDENAAVAEVQITPYREEGKYSDKRHPYSISFAKSI